MTAPARCCTRCEASLAPDGTAITITITNGPPHGPGPLLSLCPRCTESLTRWLSRPPIRPRAWSSGGKPRESRRRSRARPSRLGHYLFIATVSGSLAVLMGTALVILIREFGGG